MCEHITCKRSILQYLFYNLMHVETILQYLWLKNYKVSLKTEVFLVSEINVENMKFE